MTRFQVRNKLRKAGSKAKSIAVETLGMNLVNTTKGKSRLGIRKASIGLVTVTILGIANAQAASAVRILPRNPASNGTVSTAPSKPVPEPFTILGSLTAGGIGVALRRKRQQKEKEAAKV